MLSLLLMQHVHLFFKLGGRRYLACGLGALLNLLHDYVMAVVACLF